jgi:hypothetical protein
MNRRRLKQDVSAREGRLLALSVTRFACHTR